MDNIIVITQNVKLESLSLLRDYIKSGSSTLVFSSQLILENEKPIIEKALDSICKYVNFSDIMSDAELAGCDEDAYSENQKDMNEYYAEFKRLKNSRAIDKLLEQYPCNNRLIVCDDLGLDINEWLKKGFVFKQCDYYYSKKEEEVKHNEGLLASIKQFLKKYFAQLRTPVYESSLDGQKYLFYGSMNRVLYRIGCDFRPASKLQSIKDVIVILLYDICGYHTNSKTIRMSTLHECGIRYFPRISSLNLKLIQDGYLPPNYSSKREIFRSKCIEYYTWDVEGGRNFEYHNLKHCIMPFRKKLYLPIPNFPQKVTKVVCVASGAGDWTAVKNRSDDDKMIVAFGEVAKQFPGIDFVYRFHPTWVHPTIQGVNSIKRATEYINWLNLPNMKVSGNIPDPKKNGSFQLSFNRSSLDEEIKDADIVFGEHSISMIDAAFKKIPFCSVNVTGHRDFFVGITAMGFPHCESVEEICSFFKNVGTEDFIVKYKNAIENYNKMTDQED